MKITFNHAGVERTLSKHAEVQAALKAGTMTEAQAAAKPWYLRASINGKQHAFTIPAGGERDAIRDAKDKLKQIPTDKFQAYLKNETARKSLTVGALWVDWLAAGLPFSKTKLRTPEAADALKDSFLRALPWWQDKAVETINAAMIEDYAAHRAPALTSADRELSAVSSMLQWGVLTGRIEKNAIRVRARFAVVKQHCHDACPDDDETLHKVLAWLFDAVPERKHAGVEHKFKLAAGTLAWCALTGLREGEPKFLMRLPTLGETPANTKHLAPGTIFPTRDGKLRMKVQRLKRGQNPFVTLHPAAESFLSAWRAWLAKTMPDAKELFPIADDQTVLNRSLNAATEKLGLPHMVPHGFGRAFYVKVRRSDGIEDSAIGSELGQSCDEEMIRGIYGDPGDLVGGQLFDWLPDDCAPAWSLLAANKPLPKVVQEKVTA